MIVPPSDPAIPFAYNCLLNINNISKGHIGSLGGDDVISWIYCFGKGVDIFKLLYN